jgi:hypothetical protein
VQSGCALHCAKEAFSDGPRLSWEEWLAAGHDLHTALQHMPENELPDSAVDALTAFIKNQPTAEKLGLTDRIMWTQAGVRPPARRKPLWQPLRRK